jgi:hypothetical protein
LVFQSASSLTVGSTAAPRKLINGAKANKCLLVGSQAVINYAGGGVMVGNVV